MLTVSYSCNHCGLKGVEAQVRYRREDEDVVDWMRNAVEVTVGIDHRRRSPRCHPDRLTSIVIPVSQYTQIGGPAPF